MKRRLHYNKMTVIHVLVLLVLQTAGFAQTFERSKHIDKAYPINNNTEIQIANKYGNIHLVTWDKDSVRFEIDVLVKANKQSKVDKIYDYIDFEFTGNEYYVIAQTLFDNNRNSVWSELTDIAKVIFSSDNKAQIDYKVYLPTGNPLKLSNKFGNIYTTDHSNTFEVNLSNGDLKAHALTGKTKMNVEFGNVNVKHVTDATLDINYAQFSSDEAEKITLRSKSSEIRIEDLAELDLDSRRDKLYLKYVHKINGQASFSYFYIKNLEELFAVSTSYGEINVDDLGPGFQLMSVNSNYTDFNLTLPRELSIDLEINHDSRTNLDYPSTFEHIKKKTKNAEEETYITYGLIGKPSDEPARIDIDTKSGKIVILQF